MKDITKKPKGKKNVTLRSSGALEIAAIPILAYISTFGAQTAPGGVPTDIRQAFLNIINFLLGFVALIAVLMIVYGGVLYLTSMGNEERTGQAKSTISYAIIGLVITGFAYAIVQVIVSVILTP